MTTTLLKSQRLSDASFRRQPYLFCSMYGACETGKPGASTEFEDSLVMYQTSGILLYVPRDYASSIPEKMTLQRRSETMSDDR